MGGTSLRSVLWFDPTGGVCSKVASSSMSVFWFDPTNGFCIVSANSSRPVFWFDPTGGVCSKVTSSSILVFWFDRTRSSESGAPPPSSIASHVGFGWVKLAYFRCVASS